MHTYLSKKIAIPNNTKLNCIAWHKTEGYVSVGGDKGLLKVLKLGAGGTATSNDNDSGGSAASKVRGGPHPSNLSMNLTLDGHSESVHVVVWNETLNKLTTSDKNGVIIVWMLYKGIWYEEMVNNRNKSTVRGMAWSYDGNKICIVYEDGVVIVGAANGNRIWGKELKGVELTGVQWSPDANLLLFSLSTAELHVYDNQGNFMIKMNSDISSELPSSQLNIVTLDWYNGKNGYIGQTPPLLMVCYQHGVVKLYRDIHDEDPVTVNVDNIIQLGAWNHNASMFAIACEKRDKDLAGERNSVQFYDNFGTHLRSLKLPGRSITSCAWEGSGLRLAITIDSHIYFANLHPLYKWCFFKHTLAFSTGLWSTNGLSVAFWDIHSNMVNLVYIKKLYCMAAYNNHCVLAVQTNDSKTPEKYVLTLCDTGGVIIDENHVDIEPKFISMNSTFVIASSEYQFMLWQYNHLKSSHGNQAKRSYIYHIDDIVTGEESLYLQNAASPQSENIFQNNKTKNEFKKNPITSMACSESVLLIGRQSGEINHYELPHVSLVNKYTAPNGVPDIMKINCNSIKAAIVCGSQLSIIFLRSDAGYMRGEAENNTGHLERKDVWDVQWASDNPHMLAVMEKSRLYIFRGTNPEEPIISSGYICSFQDLEIQTVLLDEVISNPDHLSKELIVNMEIKSLRDTRELINKVGIKEAKQFIMDNPHPRLWRLLAEAALKNQDLETADVAFIYCQDLSGIEFVNQLRNIKNKNLVKAEISSYFKEFEEAEKLYMESDRRDLALSLYKKLGDWFKVLQIMTSAMRADNFRSREVYEGIGQYFFDRHNWQNMKEYFEKSGNQTMLAHCYYHLENYNALAEMIPNIGRRDPLLKKIADMLASVGLCSVAAKAYARYGQIKKAITLCTKLNEWDMAVQLAEEYSIPEMDVVLSEYVARLIKDNRVPQAIEVYRGAGKFFRAACVVNEHAKKISLEETDILIVKKWFTLAAMLFEKHQKEFTSKIPSAQELLVKNRWQNVLAYHLYGIAQIHLRAGEMNKAFIISVKLCEFDDIIPEKKLYSLLAMTSHACGEFHMCSKAFVKLISSKQITSTEKQRYNELVNEIFKLRKPKDKNPIRKECVSCETMIPAWSSICPSCNINFRTCMVTGEPLMDFNLNWSCGFCQQSADIRQIQGRKYCLLCRHSIQLK